MYVYLCVYMYTHTHTQFHFILTTILKVDGHKYYPHLINEETETQKLRSHNFLVVIQVGLGLAS